MKQNLIKLFTQISQQKKMLRSLGVLEKRLFSKVEKYNNKQEGENVDNLLTDL